MSGGGGRGTHASGAESLFRKISGRSPGATKLSPSPGPGQTERCREAAGRSRHRIWAARRCCCCCRCWFRPAFQVGTPPPRPEGPSGELALELGEEGGKPTGGSEFDELEGAGSVSGPSPNSNSTVPGPQ